MGRLAPTLLTLSFATVMLRTIPILIGFLVISTSPASAQIGPILSGLGEAARVHAESAERRRNAEMVDQEHAYRMRLLELEIARMERELEAAEMASPGEASVAYFRLTKVAGYDVPMSFAHPETGEAVVSVHGGTVRIHGDHTWSSTFSVTRDAKEALSKALLGAVRDGGSRFQRSWGR